MKIGSWEQLAIDGRKLVSLGAAAGAGVFATVALACELLEMGAASFFLASVAASGTVYLIFTAPRRAIDKGILEQAAEAPSFAASSNIFLRSTGSRSKTLLLLRADEPRLDAFLRGVRKRLLLGYDAPSAVREAPLQKSILSESVRTVVESAVDLTKARVEEGGEELDAILSSGGLDEETKLPLFIAVSFFLPIMLMLFSATSKQTDPLAIAALVVLEVVMLDITLAISGSVPKWGSERTGRSAGR